MKNKEYAIRYENNPIITKDDMPFDAECVFNSGAALYNGEIRMIVNSWDVNWSPHFMVGKSKDRVNFEIVDKEIVHPPKEYPFGLTDGFFDTRVVYMPEDECYYITYNMSCHLGGRIFLIKTKDFETFEDVGFITGVDHRNCVIFPEKFDGYYVRLERPAGEGKIGDIWMAKSPDLIHWGQKEIFLEKGTKYWESLKIGPGAPPVKTDKGWLIIYHGCREHMNGMSYHAGALLTDLKDPKKIIGKMNRYLMVPEMPYEYMGNVPQVVFPTAAIPYYEEDRLDIYYGGADTCICLAEAKLSELVDKCLEDGPLEYKYQY